MRLPIGLPLSLRAYLLQFPRKRGCLGYRVWKLRVRALSNGANRVIVWGFVLTGYKLVTDGQTVLPMLKVVPGHLSVYHYIRQRCWWLFWSVCVSVSRMNQPTSPILDFMIGIPIERIEIKFWWSLGPGYGIGKFISISHTLYTNLPLSQNSTKWLMPSMVGWLVRHFQHQKAISCHRRSSVLRPVICY